MAIVLQTQILLDPNNQIAHILDWSSLELEIEYVISAPFLQADTRFVFRGYSDIALTRPPIGVPQQQTEVPATISTVPMPAAATPPARYPYAINDRMIASNLNLAFDMDPGAAPPIGNGGGAGRFRYWVDTSTPMPTLRQCIANPSAQAGIYVANQWITIGTIDAAARKFHFDLTGVDFSGGGGGGSITLNTLTVSQITVSPGGNIYSSGPITTTGASGGYYFHDRVLPIATHYWTWYATNDVAYLAFSTTAATKISISSVGDLNVARHVAAAGTVSGQDMSAAGNISAQGSVSATLDLNASRNIGATGTVYAAGLSVTNVVATNSVSSSIYLCDGVNVINADGGVPLLYRQGGAWAIQLQSVNTYYENQGHIFRNQGAAVTFTIDASGNINATGQVQGASIYSRADIQAVGGVSAAGITANGVTSYYDIVANRHIVAHGNSSADGNINAGGSVSATGNLYAGGSVDGVYVQSRGDASVAGTLTVPAISMSGALRTSNWIYPFADHGMNIGLPGWNADSMHAYAFVVPSDRMLKTEIETPTGCLDLVNMIPPRTYRYLDDLDTKHWGFVSQEVGEVMPGFGGRHTYDNAPEGLSYNELIAVLWGAVQELSAEVETLKGVH